MNVTSYTKMLDAEWEKSRVRLSELYRRNLELSAELTRVQSQLADEINRRTAAAVGTPPAAAAGRPIHSAQPQLLRPPGQVRPRPETPAAPAPPVPAVPGTGTNPLPTEAPADGTPDGDAIIRGAKRLVQFPRLQRVFDETPAVF